MSKLRPEYKIYYDRFPEGVDLNTHEAAAALKTSWSTAQKMTRFLAAWGYLVKTQDENGIIRFRKLKVNDE